jgi:hypothetical protein
MQGDGEPVPGEAGPYPGYRAGIDPHGGGHRQIGRGRQPGPGIAGQQDAGAALLQGGGGIAAHQTAQCGALGGGEGDEVLLAHGGAPG